MDVPEGMMLIGDHEQAMTALRVEFAEAANLRQTEITALTEQVAELQSQASLSEQVATLTQQLADMTKDRDKWARDNTDLRNAQAMYLTNTEAAQTALKQMQVQMTSAAMLNLVEQLRGLGVDASGVATAIQSLAA